jgi:cytochrome c oxidase subunit 4
MSDTHSMDDIQKHVRTYVMVFASLMVLTIITVAVWRLHLPVKAAIAVALVIASIKASLVACYFMHLISEKKLILYVMATTVGLFVVLLLFPIFTVSDQIRN